MTPQDYINAGYKISPSTSQAEITKVEGEVAFNYIAPVAGTYDPLDASHKAALMALSFIGLAFASVFVTRVGGVRKNVNESEKASQEVVFERCAKIAHSNLAVLGDVRKCIDVYGIYFKSQYFGI